MQPGDTVMLLVQDDEGRGTPTPVVVTATDYLDEGGFFVRLPGGEVIPALVGDLT